MVDASRNATAPKRAMVLAAGLGTRMRAFNGQVPKPLVKVGGKPLIDYVLDRLAEQGVERAVVNVHHLADQIERHLAARQRPKIVIADERRELLGTGGGVVRALPELGQAPFFHINSDTIWIDGVQPNLGRLAAAFDPAAMDALLLLAVAATSIAIRAAATSRWRRTAAGAARRARWCRRLCRRGGPRPAFFAGVPQGPSLDVAAVRPRRQAGAFMGCAPKAWTHVGTPTLSKPRKLPSPPARPSSNTSPIFEARWGCIIGGFPPLFTIPLRRCSSRY
jgi:MurNAc alpha-1-phosphate uridylyltransferase